MNYRQQVIDLLEANHYKKQPDRGKGSHEAWVKGTHLQIVPRKVDDRNFANKILKQAGIDHRIK